MAGLQVPLSTLRLAPRDALRMTRGQSGLLFLHCWRLALFTLCRSPGAQAYFIFRFVRSGEGVKACRRRPVVPGNKPPARVEQEYDPRYRQARPRCLRGHLSPPRRVTSRLPVIRPESCDGRETIPERNL